MLLSNFQATVISLYKPPRADPPHLVAAVPDSPAQLPAASPRPTVTPSPRIAIAARSPLQRLSPVTCRPVQRSLFAALPDNQPEVLGYLKEICERQKQLAEQQQQTQERLDALIAVLSGSHEPPNVPFLQSCTESSVPVIPVPPVPTLSVPDPDLPTTASPSQCADEDVLFQLRSRASSERNFAVHLLRHMFTPSELEGRNFRGVGGKLPLNAEKVTKIKEIVFRFFPASLTHQDLLWRDCRKAIDAYLRNRKIIQDRSQ